MDNKSVSKILFPNTYIIATSYFNTIKDVNLANSLASEHGFKGVIVDTEMHKILGSVIYGESIVFIGYPYSGICKDLNIDFIKTYNKVCPNRLGLAVFINKSDIVNTNWSSIKTFLKKLSTINVDRKIYICVNIDWFKNLDTVSRFLSIIQIWTNLIPIIEYTESVVNQQEMLKKIVSVCNFFKGSTLEESLYLGHSLSAPDFSCKILSGCFSNIGINLDLAKIWSTEIN